MRRMRERETLIEDYEERAEAALEELTKSIETTIDNYRKRAEQAETPLEKWKKTLVLLLKNTKGGPRRLRRLQQQP
jgi:hypothetical protein